MASVYIKNAKAVVTVDSQDSVLYNTGIFIEDGVITYIGDSVKEADETIDASGCFVYPGLVNTHHHLYQTLQKTCQRFRKWNCFPGL